MRRVLILGCILVLAGCATIREVPSGSYEVNGAYEVRLNGTWAELPPRLVGDINGQILTIDGPRLNRLQLVGHMQPGESLVEQKSEEQRVPRYHADMTPTEIVGFITDSLAAENYRNIETAALRPAAFGSLDGVRFDLDAATESGLKISGTVLFAEQGENLNVILYLAPSEYYYEYRMSAVEAIMASANLI